MSGDLQHTSTKQDREFVERLGEELSMDATWVVEWVGENFEPHNVFSVDDLETWARDNGFIRVSECAGQTIS